jgi:hypothetical protein
MNIKTCLLKIADAEDDASILYHNYSQNCSERLKPVLLAFSKEEATHKFEVLELAAYAEFDKKYLHEDAKKFLLKQLANANGNSDSLNFAIDKDFFKYALQLEKNSIEIYRCLMEVLQSESYGYDKLGEMINTEKRHMLYILNQLYELK